MDGRRLILNLIDALGILDNTEDMAPAVTLKGEAALACAPSFPVNAKAACYPKPQGFRMPPSDTLTSPARPASPQRTARAPSGGTDRFIAFAFAAADLLVETDINGVIGFAAGAFPSRFGRTAQDFIGSPITSLFAATDHETLDIALAMIQQSGRIAPMQLTLADPGHSQVSVGAFLLQMTPRCARLSFSIGPIAAGLGDACSGAHTLADPRGFTRIAELAMRHASQGGLGLVEVQNWQVMQESMSGADQRAIGVIIGDVLGAGASGGSAGVLAAGRYGVVADSPLDMTDLVRKLETALQGSPAEGRAIIRGTEIPLAHGTMPAAQAARALRYALGRFADGGTEAAKGIGAEGGLEGIIACAGHHAKAVRETLEGRRFRLLYQPVVRLTDRSIHHFEALIRPFANAAWPNQAPQEFVTFAEALGLSEELDWAVLETVITALENNRDVCIAVNMSGLSIQNPDYRRRILTRIQQVRATSEKHAPSRLMIELTETAEIDDLEAAASTMEQLRSVGVPVCLDDFGAGVAVFRYLRAFGVDHVKLDGDYVRASCKTRRDRALVASMVELAASAGASVVAEMIETEEQVALMRELGVEFGQGWLFGRPGRLPGS